MSFDYIASGISIINDIEYADHSLVKGRLGGCAVFACSGLCCFTDSVLFLSSGGPDFFDYYGRYFEENKIARDGIYLSLPHTHHTLLKYEKDGSWKETSVYGADYFETQSENNRTSLDKLRPFLNKDTKGLYLDSSAQEAIFEEIEGIRKLSPDMRILWEPPTFSSKDPLMHGRVLENLHKVDIYSMNLDEAASFFGKKGRDEIIASIIELGIPCFLREGENGSSFINNGEVTSHPAIQPEKAVDVTGCGNTSAAAALYLYREGYDPKDIVYYANLAAGHCALHEGPPPVQKIL